MTCFVLSTDRSDDPGSDQSERCTQGDGHVSDRHQWKIIIDEDECRSRTRTKQFSWPIRIGPTRCMLSEAHIAVH